MPTSEGPETKGIRGLQHVPAQRLRESDSLGRGSGLASGSPHPGVHTLPAHPEAFNVFNRRYGQTSSDTLSGPAGRRVYGMELLFLAWSPCPYTGRPALMHSCTRTRQPSTSSTASQAAPSALPVIPVLAIARTSQRREINGLLPGPDVFRRCSVCVTRRQLNRC